jgi:hypothetical protein
VEACDPVTHAMHDVHAFFLGGGTATAGLLGDDGY